MKSAARKLARQRLDERLSPFREVERFLPPPKGWVRALRDALGMTTVQLAGRMGVSSQAITGLEQSEEGGTIRLNTLRKAAEALDATVVYMLVPNTSLERMVEHRARWVAARAVERVNQTMLLEGQGTSEAALEAALEGYVENLRDRELWDDPNAAVRTGTQP